MRLSDKGESLDEQLTSAVGRKQTFRVTAVAPMS
jgi:hypothetical protein